MTKERKTTTAEKLDAKIQSKLADSGPSETAQTIKTIKTRPALIAAGWILWVILALFLAILTIAALTLLLQYLNLLDLKNVGTVATFWIDASLYIVMFLIVMWLPWRNWRRKNRQKNHKNSWKFLRENVGLQRRAKLVDVKYFFANLPIFYLTVLAFSILAGVLLGQETMNQEQNIGFTTSPNSLELIVIAIALIGVAPLFEEMIMRGFLFGKLRKVLPIWPAAMIVSLLFALAHGQINVGIMTFILSMFSCRLREKTGAIWAGIFLHMAVNAVAFSVRFLVV